MAKILVADDNSNIQKMVGLALKDQGIDVVAVGNGEAAVRKLADVKPDLVLADVFMPVRNGYEVCQYIKQDPNFSHIPVILLVGAFDPLDEQEAQRVGADGVLKKPFVPPDPLISMVKSALARAGVHVGPAVAAPEKPAEPSRSAADLLRATAAAKAAAEVKVPEAEAEPVDEDFPPMPSPLKIDAGHEPLAFGNLLGTAEVEDDAAFVAKGNGATLEHSWGAESDEVEEETEEEEESSHGGWRPGGLDAQLEEAATGVNSAPDWREEAFHGNSPARNGRVSQWTPSAEKTKFAEVAEAPSIGISTLEHKPAAAPIPFSGDAWAAAMAAGVEEKLASTAADVVTTEAEHIAPHVNEIPEVIPAEEKPVPVIQNAAVVEAEPAAIEPAPILAEDPVIALEETKIPETKGTWYSVPPSPWDVEAKKVSQLAATWDTPVVKGTEETQEIPVYEEAAKAEEVPARGTLTAVSPSVREVVHDVAHEDAAPTHETAATSSNFVVPAEQEAQIENSPETVSSSFTEIDEPKVETAESIAPVQPQANQMDELVARVLQRMNPDVLQKVTQEILKPIIEALVKDELESKK
ncbi:MAG TPA: response regulator [Candidatus Acidoferrum sp.]